MNNIAPTTILHQKISDDTLAEFCAKWSVRRLWVFGSALRDDFGPHSDVDLLVEFMSETAPSLWQQIAMEEELAALLGRKVDLVERKAVEEGRNWIRRREILATAKEVYAAG